MKFIKKALFLLLFMSVIGLSSCEDEFLLPSPEKVENTQLFSEVLSEILSVWRRFDEGIRNPTVVIGGQVILDQATVAINGNTLVIDFGNIQKLCADGKTRRGRIEATLSGEYGTSGSFATINFIGFRVDDKPISGQVTVTAISNKPVFQLTSNNFLFRDFLFQINSEIDWISGFNTALHLDDTIAFKFEGMANRQQNSTYGFYFKSETNQDIIVALACEYRVLQGILGLKTQTDSSNIVLDFVESDKCNDVVRVHFVNEKYTTFFKFSGF